MNFVDLCEIITPNIVMVPAAGLEPARIIHPPDFESGTSTNFITRGLDDMSRLLLQQNYDNMEFHGLQFFLLHFLECSNP